MMAKSSTSKALTLLNLMGKSSCASAGVGFLGTVPPTLSSCLSGSLRYHTDVNRMYIDPRYRSDFSESGIDDSRIAFVHGFDNSLPVEEAKNLLVNHFGSCGEISYIRVAPHPQLNSGSMGLAHLGFSTVDGFSKALKLTGTQLGNKRLIVEKGGLGPLHRPFR